MKRSKEDKRDIEWAVKVIKQYATINLLSEWNNNDRMSISNDGAIYRFRCNIPNSDHIEFAKWLLKKLRECTKETFGYDQPVESSDDYIDFRVYK